MTHGIHSLTAEDHAYRRSAETYFAQKSPVARERFEAEQLQVFSAFEEHWAGFFAPSHPARLLEYLSLPFELRKARFERFLRECRAWEITFDLAAPPRRGQARSTGDAEMEELRRRSEDQRARADQVRTFYDGLDGLLDRENQRRTYPLALLPHLRVLELATDATLEDVKRQYKRLAKVHHPDRQGDAVTMGRLAEAYRALLAFHKVA